MANSVEHNRQAQRELYGEPLGELLGGVAERLSLTQSRIAAVLGISAPMLSQLMSGQRVKIGNPAAAARLQELVSVSANAEGLTAEQVSERLDQIASASDWVTSTAHRVATPPVPTEAPSAPYRLVQDLFRDVASAADYLAAARSLESAYPQIAELLAVYGAGRTAEAREHYTRNHA
ncbi:DNA-binding protein [Epidermidibacterium keratini]|uniref:DNA-binding protein n=1 Tax=Epidermidibacterium keratini TaxID=1891644 RepID=UPI001CEFA30B|nr:DNA-binding protein [Epidermidibacterium keratini]